MASYKHVGFLAQTTGAKFDEIHPPGYPTPFSGIYRCEGCGLEVVSEESKSLPPQNHHQHTPPQGAIRWRLVVHADHKPN